MGNSPSKIIKKIYIGKSNVSAPGILRLYNLEDNVFPYKLNTDNEEFPDVHLESKRLKIEKKMMNKMKLSPRHFSLSKEEKEIYNNVYDKEVTAKRIIINGRKIHDLFYDPVEDKSQIYLCRQFVVELDENIGRIKELRILQACCNYISRLPLSLGMLVNLKVLILSRNRISRLPDEIGNLTNLRELNLSHNFLESLPSTITSLRLLNALHIDNNRFNSLPCFIGSLKSLKYLNISNNNISFIPFSILKLPFLIELTSDSCKFEHNESLKKQGKMTLQEICSRHLVRNNLSVYKNIDVPLIKYLLSVEECSFCGGPLFDFFYLVKTKHVFENKEYPVAYKMCCKHYAHHKKRIEAMFSVPHKTFPYKLIARNKPYVSELFNNLENKKIGRFDVGSLTNRANLVELTKFNKNNFLNGVYERVSFFHEE